MTSIVNLTELLTINTDGAPVDRGNPLFVAPENIIGKFRDAFETFVPGEKWTLSQDSGDIVQLDGNAAGASYLVISKDPLTVGGVTTLETINTFEFPFETAVGLSMSQRTLGQELSMELVSTETPLTPPSELAIASITQAATLLGVTTTAPHGLVPGQRIGIYGVTGDSRLNYPSLVVSAIPSTTQFQCTAGPNGTIPSITAGPYNNQGFVYFRSALGYAPNGISEIFENASATNASMYVRAAAGDVLPSGTANGNQSVTITTTASAQAVLAANTYAFLPSTEYRVIAQADRVQLLDAAVDTTSAPSSRLLRTQVVPDSTKQYKQRFRFTNNKGLSTPVGKIVSAVKTGSSTVTITTDQPHGLTTGDWTAVIGIRDQTNFVSTTTNLAVLSVPSSTTFTTAFGTSVTATSYGGCVIRQNGSNIPAAYSTVAAQTATVTSTSFGNQLTLVGSANWQGTVGDYVNVYGVRNATNGADLGVDGTYKVSDIATTTIVLLPIGSTTLPTTFGVTNCGGTVIKRTDARIAFVRVFDYVRERVEVQANSVTAASVPVVVNGTASISGGVVPQSQNTYSLQSSTNLASSATFTGTGQNIAQTTTSAIVLNAQLVVGVTHTAGQTPGQLYVDFGTETSSTLPTTWFTGLAVPIPSNANWTYFSIPISTRFYRVRFVNGPVAQTNFRLATIIAYNGGGLSNQLGYPQQLNIPISTTTIGVSGVQTSVGLDFGNTMSVYKTISFTAFADQASATNGFQVQVSRDNSTWRVAAQTTLAANTLTTLTVQLVYQFVRVVFTNGTVAQTTFQMDARAEVG